MTNGSIRGQGRRRAPSRPRRNYSDGTGHEPAIAEISRPVTARTALSLASIPMGAVRIRLMPRQVLDPVKQTLRLLLREKDQPLRWRSVPPATLIDEVNLQIALRQEKPALSLTCLAGGRATPQYRPSRDRGRQTHKPRLAAPPRDLPAPPAGGRAGLSADDGEAIEKAKRLSRDFPIELWNGTRFAIRLEPKTK